MSQGLTQDWLTLCDYQGHGKGDAGRGGEGEALKFVASGLRPLIALVPLWTCGNKAASESEIPMTPVPRLSNISQTFPHSEPGHRQS